MFSKLFFVQEMFARKISDFHSADVWLLYTKTSTSLRLYFFWWTVMRKKVWHWSLSMQIGWFWGHDSIMKSMLIGDLRTIE